MKRYDARPPTQILFINRRGWEKYFLKTRGSLGYMLNISQDMLLLLTALSLKKERKPLKQVFIDLEARGLFFDRYSKEEIVQLFDKLNLIDKKVIAVMHSMLNQFYNYLSDKLINYLQAENLRGESDFTFNLIIMNRYKHFMTH